MPKQIHRLHQRHSGLEERRKFLVEDEEFMARDFAPFRQDVAAAQDTALPQRDDVQALGLEIMAETGLAFRRVGPLDDLATRRDQPTAKFHAKWLKL
jgi:hypothetical protein